jgi:hypothetical protein
MSWVDSRDDASETSMVNIAGDSHPQRTKPDLRKPERTPHGQ